MEIISSGEGDSNTSSDEPKVEKVDNLPYNIDGDSNYKLAYDPTPGNTFRSSIDGQKWSRKNKSYIGVNSPTKKRWYALCKGSIQCPNKECPFVLLSDKKNHAHVKSVGTEKFCKECEHPMVDVRCDAKKKWEFREDKYVIVRHTGTHKCPATQKPVPPQEFRNELLKDPSLKPSTASSKILMNAVRCNESTTNINELAFNLSDDRQLRNLKQKLNNKKSTMEQLSELQEKCVYIMTHSSFMSSRPWKKGMTTILSENVQWIPQL